MNNVPKKYRIGVDIGGTFTDIVLIDPHGGITVKKVSSSVTAWRLGHASESGRAGENSLAVPAKRRFSAAGLVHTECQKLPERKNP